jgi:hypothetical protein
MGRNTTSFQMGLDPFPLLDRRLALPLLATKNVAKL